jgi:hypothetical protein
MAWMACSKCNTISNVHALEYQLPKSTRPKVIRVTGPLCRSCRELYRRVLHRYMGATNIHVPERWVK